MKQIETIKRTTIQTLISVVTIAFAGSQQLSAQKAQKVDWLTLSDSAQKTIVQEYVCALDSFALAMPAVGGDTESAWAADMVHTMAQRIREGNHSFLENMADIYLMHDYIVYGMSYRHAIIGLPYDADGICNYVLTKMLPRSDSLHQAIRANGYKSLEAWNNVRIGAIFNMQLFNTLNGMGCQPPYEDPNLEYGINCKTVLDSIASKGIWMDRELYQAACFLESSLFFKMIVPLIILFDGSSGEFVTRNNGYITEAAHYFDERTTPVFDYFNDGKELTHLSDQLFEEYMLKATGYKAGLLRIATQELHALKHKK